jgi:hypothetical protein
VDEPGLPSVAYVRFPPRWHNVLLPTRPGRAATVGMSLYTASKPIAVALQQSLWLAARLSGARVLPGRRETWVPPVETDVYGQLWSDWTELVGRPIDGAAVYERLQSERASLTLLLCAGSASLLVRVRRNPAELERELTLSAAAATRRPRGFHVPAAAGRGATADWHWAAYEAIATRPHLPRYRLADETFDEVTDLVEHVTPRPVGTPEHWRGAHGDIVPWNLRRARRRTWLIDWEDAAWAPPGTDRLYLSAVVAAMRPGRVVPASGPDEARAHLRRIVTERPTSASEQKLRTRLLTALG